jgi:hypothetical protein
MLDAQMLRSICPHSLSLLLDAFGANLSRVWPTSLGRPRDCGFNTP